MCSPVYSVFADTLLYTAPELLSPIFDVRPLLFGDWTEGKFSEVDLAALCWKRCMFSMNVIIL